MFFKQNQKALEKWVAGHFASLLKSSPIPGGLEPKGLASWDLTAMEKHYLNTSRGLHC